MNDLPVIWVRPDEITHWPFMRDLLHPIKVTSMVKCVDRWRQTSVQTEYTIRNNGSHGQIVKGIRKMFPDVGISIFSEAFIIKAINLSNLTTLVISTKDCNAVSVSNFQGHEKGDSFQ